MRVAVVMVSFSYACAATTPAPSAGQRAIMEADRRFDADTAERGAEGWVSWFAANGSMLPGEGPPLIGHDAIRAAMTPVLAEEGASLRWQPDRAEILVPGGLGVTTGTYVSTSAPDERGVQKRSTGRYISVWKRIDGAWKVIFDTGQPD